MPKKILNYLVLFLSISLVFQLFLEKPTPTVDPATNPITFETSKDSYSKGKVIELEVRNNTDKRLVFKTSCPDEPFTVLYTTPAEPVVKTKTADVNCEDQIDPSTKDLTVNPGKKGVISYNYWSSSLFDELGRYKITATLNFEGEEIKVASNEFEIEEVGLFGTIWQSVLYQPIYNFLILLISLIPGKSLGLAIILLTIIIRSILFGPSYKAMKQQKKMAKIQPQLAHLKEKYKDDQQKLAQETMKIWKENKVNPLSSCLPLLIQFPILIALFYVIQNGLNPDKTYLLYSFLADFNFHDIQTVFLNILPLTTKNAFVLPIIVGLLQFAQIKLSMPKKEKAKEEGKKSSEIEKAQGLMLYFMPGLIAVFTASLPAGVGLYWGASTLFSIVQQLIINRKEK